MGGMAGMVMGNPLMGMMAGGATAGLIGLLFNNQNNNQQQSQYSNYYPQANYGGGYGNYGGNYGGGYRQLRRPAHTHRPMPATDMPQLLQATILLMADSISSRTMAGSSARKVQASQSTTRQAAAGNVSVDGGKLTLTDPSGEHKIEHSGDPHEYVDGKHIKDWDEKTRTLILGDGTKITMNATGPQGTIQNYSIYDGAQSIQIDANGNKIDNVSFNPRQRQWADANQSDGETAYVRL